MPTLSLAVTESLRASLPANPALETVSGETDGESVSAPNIESDMMTR